MEPHRRAGEGRVERVAPDADREVAFPAVHPDEQVAHLGVEVLQRSAAEGAVRAGPRRAGRVGGAQGDEERREVRREAHRVLDDRAGCRHSGEPAVDRPRRRKALGRPADAAHDRDGQRNGSREARQPRLLLRHLGHVARCAGKSHAEVVAEPVDPVVVASALDESEGERAPLRELLVQQAADQRLIDQRGVDPSGVACAGRSGGPRSPAHATVAGARTGPRASERLRFTLGPWREAKCSRSSTAPISSAPAAGTSGSSPASWPTGFPTRANRCT